MSVRRMEASLRPTTGTYFNKFLMLPFLSDHALLTRALTNSLAR